MKNIIYVLVFIFLTQSQIANANDDLIAEDYFGLEISWVGNSTFQPVLNLMYTDSMGEELKVPLYSKGMYKSNMSCGGSAEQCKSFYLGAMTLFFAGTYLMYKLDIYE